MPDNVIIDTADRIRRIEIDRADKKNALTQAMYAAMADALIAADADAAVRVILVHGKPDCFTAGNDLKDFLERPPNSSDEGQAFRFIRTISQTKKPIVAAVGGAAVGIGTTMLLHCELVFAAPDSRFQLPFVSLGLVPEAASSLLLPLFAGYQRAAELLLLARPFDADKALAAGFVNEIVPQAELFARARAAAAALAALPPSSVQHTKRLMKRSREALVKETMVEESSLFRERLAGPEAKEAMTAFFEKRKPDFSRF